MLVSGINFVKNLEHLDSKEKKMAGYNDNNDRLIKKLTTIIDPERNSKIEVSVRSYNGGKNKIALERIAENGQQYKLGRLSETEWDQLCNYIRSGESGAVTGVKLFE